MPLPRRQRVAAYAVIVRDERILLSRLADRISAQELWTLPGGGLDHGEDPRDAVIREIREETGLEIEPREFLGHWLEPYDGRIVLCLAWTAGTRGQARAADDLVEVRWFAPDELPAAPELAFTHYPEVLERARAERAARRGT